MQLYPLSFRSSILAAALAFASSAHAVIVAEYQFTGGSAANSASSGIASATSISYLPGSISSTSSQFFIQNTGNAIPDSLALSLSNNNFLGFTVTPTGDNLAFSSLSFGFGLTNNTTTVTTYTGNWAVFSSIDGFTSGSQIATGSFSLPNGSGAGGTFISPSPVVSLTGVSGLQNVGGAVQFRIYYWDNYASGSSSLAIRFDDIQLDAAAVPEPGTMALFALGLGVCVWRTRRRAATV